METVRIPTPTPGSESGFRDGFFGMRGDSSTYRNGTTPSFSLAALRGRFDNQGPLLMGVGGALLFLSICLLVARLWVRLSPVYRLKMDDWAVVGATILATAQYILLALAVLNGLGRRMWFVPAPRRSTAMRYLFISQLFWYWSVTLVKLSVALFLLRLKQTRPWRLFLSLIMCIAVAAAIVQTAFQFLQCRPFSVFWDPRLFRSVVCLRRSIINGNIIVFSSIQVALDLIYSLIPITFVRKLSVSRREKICMCVLMALGLLASCAAVVRTLSLQEYYATPDSFRSSATITLYAVLEQHLALMAATVPTLKAFVESVLVRVGLWFYDEESEKHARGQLVIMGLLDEGEELAKNEGKVGVKTAASRVAKVGNRGEPEMRDEADRDGEGSGGGEISLAEMLAMSENEKEFV